MRTTNLLLCTLLAAGAGCYHNQTPAPQSVRREVRLEDTIVAAHRGAPGPWALSGYYVEALGKGGVRVTRESGWQSRVPVSGVSSAWITTKIISKFTADSNLDSSKIKIKVNSDGLVELSGHVRSSREAARAVDDALDISGVNAVDTHLRWG
jgi:hypothetical protein